MDSGQNQNSKPPYAIRCKCCNKAVCYSYEKISIDSVFCYICTKSINVFSNKYLKLNKYNEDLEEFEFNFDKKAVLSIDRNQMFNAVWRFSVNEHNYIEEYLNDGEESE